MTPAPATASARRQASARPATRRAPAAPRAPRRVSGPARTPAPQRRAALAGAPVALPRPAIGAGLSPRVGAWVRNLPDHRLLDRLIRGRAWIVLLGVLLAGIVALQVSMLRLNSGISRAVEHEQTLQRENQALQASVAALGSDSRLRILAERQGFYTPTAGSERYLSAGTNDAQRAARAMRPPQAHATIPPPVAATTTAAATTTSSAPAATTTTTTTPPAATTTPTTTTTTTTAQTIPPPTTGTTNGAATGSTGVTPATGTTTGTTTGGAGAGG